MLASLFSDFEWGIETKPRSIWLALICDSFVGEKGMMLSSLLSVFEWGIKTKLRSIWLTIFFLNSQTKGAILLE